MWKYAKEAGTKQPNERARKRTQDTQRGHELPQQFRPKAINRTPLSIKQKKKVRLINNELTQIGTECGNSKTRLIEIELRRNVRKTIGGTYGGTQRGSEKQTACLRDAAGKVYIDAENRLRIMTRHMQNNFPTAQRTKVRLIIPDEIWHIQAAQALQHINPYIRTNENITRLKHTSPPPTGGGSAINHWANPSGKAKYSTRPNTSTNGQQSALTISPP